MTLLFVWIVLLNAWVLLQFGLELKAVFFIEGAIALAAFLMKALTKRDNAAVHAALQRAFYSLLRTPVLIAAYIALAVLVLTVSPAPTVLVRVGYKAHFALAGGTIEVRDTKTNQIVTTAKTTAESASLLLGRTVALPEKTVAAWDGDLAGLAPVPAQNARNRWRNFVRPATDVRLEKGQQLEAVFRTRAQVIAARQPFTVEGGNTLQDVVMKKVP